MSKKEKQIYGQAIQTFVDSENYNAEECVFYYRVLKKLMIASEPLKSNYFISGLKEIMNQPEFGCWSLFERRFNVGMYQSVDEIANILGISKQGLLKRYEEAYKYIRRQDNKYDIAKRIALLKESIMQLRTIREKHSSQHAVTGASIADLPLKTRTYSCLKAAGITSIIQFTRLTEKQIKKIPGAGAKTVEDIISNQRKLEQRTKNSPYPEISITIDTVIATVTFKKLNGASGEYTLNVIHNEEV